MNRRQFESFYLGHADEVLIFLMAKGLTRQEAEDITQESLIRFWERRERAQAGKEAGFLFGIARTLLLEHWRKKAQARQAISSFEQGEFHSSEKRSDAVLMSREHHSMLREAIEKLPARIKEIIQLIHFDGHSKAEAARRLGISRQAAAQYHKQALNKLKEILLEDND